MLQSRRGTPERGPEEEESQQATARVGTDREKKGPNTEEYEASAVCRVALGLGQVLRPSPRLSAWVRPCSDVGRRRAPIMSMSFN